MTAPAVITLGIAAVLAVWAAYALSGAGLISRLPLLRTGLVLISAIYLSLGLMLFPLILLKPKLVDTFLIWSSVVVLADGLTHAIGTFTSWRSLSR